MNKIRIAVYNELVSKTPNCSLMEICNVSNEAEFKDIVYVFKSDRVSTVS